MPFRSDVDVNFFVSPRIITVQAPSTSINIQDLWDTIGTIEAKVYNTQFRGLILNGRSGGKQTVSGASVSGIILTLNNARLAFQQRTNLLESGSVTTGSVAPDARQTISLIDSAATFQANNVQAGDLVINSTDSNSLGVVESTVSETELEVFTPAAGADNQYDIGDAYEVYEVVQCDITGGVLGARDLADVVINPVLPTFGTYVTRETDVSAALLSGTGGLTQQQVRDAMYLAPSPGSPATASVDKKLDDLVSDIFANLVDGVPFSLLMERLMAKAVGKFVENPADTIKYFKQDGTTESFTQTYSEDSNQLGTRQTSTP